MTFRKMVMGNLRTQQNSGFAAYIGSRRCGWSFTEEGAIQAAIEAVKSQPQSRRFVPGAVVFDCSLLVNVAFVGDDANGLHVTRLHVITV